MNMQLILCYNKFSNDLYIINHINLAIFAIINMNKDMKKQNNVIQMN